MWDGKTMAPSGDSLWIARESTAHVLCHLVGNGRPDSVDVLAEGADLVHLGFEGDQSTFTGAGRG